jgi:fructose/tagatose bisphosphate aldolase
MAENDLVVLVFDWQQTKAVLEAARAAGRPLTLITPRAAAETYGAGYLGALQDRADLEFPDVAFTLVVDCGESAGYAMACLRAGVRTVSLQGASEVVAKVADIARQKGAAVVERPAQALDLAAALAALLGSAPTKRRHR